MSDEGDNVIHVSFGADGTGQKKPRPEPAAEDSGKERRRDRDRADPLADLYGMGEVARLFELTVGRLRYWDRSGFIAPSARSGRRRYYTFQDLISIRAAKGLLAEGVPLKRVKRSVEALRHALPKVVRPLSELRVVADGSTVLVQDEEGAFEPVTGQLVLDFRVDALRRDVVRVLHGRHTTDEQRRSAYELYLEGCRLDEDEATFDLAEDAYRGAIRLDPSLANALTNLGNLRYRRGDAEHAERLYHQALALDSEQPEALYNLGFLAFEHGQLEVAIGRFVEAITVDPAFADAHFNLAMASDELGRLADARAHFEVYLELEPTGSWSEVARRHLRALA